MNQKIYTDTNALRYFGTAFASASLAEDLRDQLLLAPFAVMELLSQLGTGGAKESFAAVKALPRVHNPSATGMLPWPDDSFRMSLFRLPPGRDVVTPAMNNAILNVLDAASPEDVKKDGEEIRALLDAAKQQSAEEFSDVLNARRTEGPLPEQEHKAIFARSVARQAGTDECAVDVDFVVDSLNAFYVFESTRMRIGAESREYNVNRRCNDIYDAELLVYLSDPTLHLLTSDKGFRRAEKSPQFSRVHIVEPGCLRDAERAERVIREILGKGGSVVSH